MEWYELILLILSLIWIIFSALPLIQVSWWWIRVLDYPRIQILILGTATMLAYLILVFPFETFDFILMAILSAGMIYQGYMVFPFTIISKKESMRNKNPDPDRTFDIIISNVRQKNRDYDKIIELIKKYEPDVVITVETDEVWAEHLEVIEKDYPYSIKCPINNTYGMLLFSQLELVNSKKNFYLKDDIPSFITQIKLRSGDLIKLYSLHPEPPQINQDTDQRDAEILMAAKSIENNAEHAVIVGDLNDVGWSHTTKLFRKMSKMLDPRIGRGMYNTYNANVPFFRWPLDHIFHTDHFKLVELIRLSHIGSDHFPMYVKLEYTYYENGQDAPEADADDHEEAEERIQDGMEEKG